jgi:lipoprotein-anchoring transpeptidase ErfK/SrfK
MKDFLEQNPWLVYPLHVVLIGIIVLFSWLLLKDVGVFPLYATPTGEVGSVAASLAETAQQEPTPEPKSLETYLRVTSGCGIHYAGTCATVHSGPGINFPVVAQLRNDIVLRVASSETHDGETWYRIIFDEGLRYPERVKASWYVAGDFVQVFQDEGERTNVAGIAGATSTKKIVVNRTKETLIAYDGDTVFMSAKVSTGLLLTPTPRGIFTIFKKTPTRYMQGPIPEAHLSQYYDLPGVPWNLYFTEQGAVIHGAYWHDDFGKPHSHGCVNLSPQDAEQLYHWADVGVPVVIED